jgi:hypothetical protein
MAKRALKQEIAELKTQLHAAQTCVTAGEEREKNLRAKIESLTEELNGFWDRMNRRQSQADQWAREDEERERLEMEKWNT